MGVLLDTRTHAHTSLGQAERTVGGTKQLTIAEITAKLRVCGEATFCFSFKVEWNNNLITKHKTLTPETVVRVLHPMCCLVYWSIWLRLRRGNLEFAAIGAVLKFYGCFSTPDVRLSACFSILVPSGRGDWGAVGSAPFQARHVFALLEANVFDQLNLQRHSLG